MTKWLWYVNIGLIGITLLTLVLGFALKDNPDEVVAMLGGPEKGSQTNRSEQVMFNGQDQSSESPLVAAVREYSQRWEPPAGTLIVEISPPDATAKGAMWRIKKGKWQKSGAKLEKVPIGTYQIEFKPIPNLVSPKLNVTIDKRKTYKLSAVYTVKPPPEYGKLTVNIEPKDIAVKAQWRVGASEWLSSGKTLEKVLAGKQRVTFSNIDGWIAPKVTAEIQKDKLAVVKAVYTVKPPQEYGTLTVNIVPERVVEKGAQWRLPGGKWQNSGAELKNVPVGTQTIEFKPVQTWIAPQKVTVKVEKDKTALAVGTYKGIKPLPPKFTLTGTLAYGNNQGVAWVKLPTESKDTCYLVGETIEQYVLREVHIGSVVLTRNGYEYTLKVPPPTKTPLASRPESKVTTTVPRFIRPTRSPLERRGH